MTEYTIIDVDAHITEAPDTWTSRVAAKYVDRVPHVRRVDGKDVWFIDGQMASPVGPTAPAGWTSPVPAMPNTYEDLLPAAYDARARLALLDEVGIWAQLLYPNVGGFGGQRFLRLKDRELMYECVRAYNDWQYEWASADAQPVLDAKVFSIPHLREWRIENDYFNRMENGFSQGYRSDYTEKRRLTGGYGFLVCYFRKVRSPFERC